MSDVRMFTFAKDVGLWVSPEGVYANANEAIRLSARFRALSPDEEPQPGDVFLPAYQYNPNAEVRRIAKKYIHAPGPS